MDLPRCTSLGYSLKNIPIPSANANKKRLIEKEESVVKGVRWGAFHFLKGDEGNTDSRPANFGLKSRKFLPQIDELKPFEDNLMKIIENIEFRRVSDPFQNALKKDIQAIRNSDEITVRADKTRNL